VGIVRPNPTTSALTGKRGKKPRSGHRWGEKGRRQGGVDHVSSPEKKTSFAIEKGLGKKESVWQQKLGEAF